MDKNAAERHVNRFVALIGVAYSSCDACLSCRLDEMTGLI